MNEFENLLIDRVDKIKTVINKYGEDNFYISFSGGKDSTVLSWLIDYALPGNTIPRVYADTGIEFEMIRKFVYKLAENDKRFDIIKPSTPIKQMLEKEGYPFKSKEHARFVAKYQKKGLEYKSVRAYMKLEPTLSGKPIFRGCPKKLMYQFSEENKLKISDMCCIHLKEEPLLNYSKDKKDRTG